MSEVQFINIAMADLEPNQGQLADLPENPRKITEEKFELLKRNIAGCPEMLSLRGLLVYPLPNKRYIIIGGNMRYKAMLELGCTEAPCVIIPKDTPIERLKAYTIIDNNGFGKYDWELLADEWDAQQLTDWGVDLPIVPENINLDEFFDEESEKQKDGGEKITVSIPKELAEQKSEITEAIKEALKDYDGIKVK